MKKYYLPVVFFLSLALFIYVFYRTDKTVINQIILCLVSPEKFAAARIAIHTALPLPGWVLHSLPEAFWVFCATLLSKNLFFTVKHYAVKCVYVPIGFAFLWEIFQLTGITKGYFDVIDLLSCSIAWMLAVRFFKPPYALTHLFSPFTFKPVLFFLVFAIVYLSHVVK